MAVKAERVLMHVTALVGGASAFERWTEKREREKLERSTLTSVGI